MKINIHSSGRIIESGDIQNGAAYNLTSPSAEALISDPVNATANGASFLTGTASPEGSVTAPPNRGYYDTSAKHIWVKQTGTGNTGWVDATAATPSTPPIRNTLEVFGTPGEGKVPTWNATNNRLEWASPSSSSGMVELGSTEAFEYVGSPFALGSSVTVLGHIFTGVTKATSIDDGLAAEGNGFQIPPAPVAYVDDDLKAVEPMTVRVTAQIVLDAWPSAGMGSWELAVNDNQVNDNYLTFFRTEAVSLVRPDVDLGRGILFDGVAHIPSTDSVLKLWLKTFGLAGGANVTSVKAQVARIA